MLSKLTPYNKFILALVGAILSVVVQFYGNNEVIQIAIPILTALGVYKVPNTKVEG